MFAVIQLAGKQYLVKEKDDLVVDRLTEKEEGTNLKIKEVLLVGNEDGTDVKVGTPFVKKALVEVKVVTHGKGEKIRVFKMKSKKRYARTYGHRQPQTTLKVLKITAL